MSLNPLDLGGTPGWAITGPDLMPSVWFASRGDAETYMATYLSMGDVRQMFAKILAKETELANLYKRLADKIDPPPGTPTGIDVTHGPVTKNP
jgi:hypothetical protein